MLLLTLHPEIPPATTLVLQKALVQASRIGAAAVLVIEGFGQLDAVLGDSLQILTWGILSLHSYL